MKIITFNDDTITKYDVATSTTDSDGYYCLEWDGYSNTPTHAENTKSFAYRVYEVLKDGWSYWSIEKGPVNTTPEVMADEDVLIEDGRVSVQVGETNGYVYANKAYHVDFYNYQDGEVDTDTDRYIIKGYIWHDNNENTLWDGFEEEQQGEEGLSGWTVSITNGETKYSTTTDENGYYFFEVPAGTWTITETVEDGWGSTTQTEYIVTVPEVLVVTFLQSLVEYIIPTAHAAVIGEYGPYNFGNNELSITTTGGGGGGGGGRRLSTPSPTPQVLGVSDTPILEVLGDQITVVPTGGVGAGRGGSSNTGSGVVTYISVLTILFSLFIFRTSVLCK